MDSTYGVVNFAGNLSQAGDTRGVKPDAWAPILAAVPLFSELGKRHLKRVAALAHMRRVVKHTRIVKREDRGDAFYVILDGGAVVEPGGIALGPGAYFGELALIDDGPRTADVTATEESLLLEISRTRFARLLRDEPTIAVAMLGELARRLRAR
jgi:CRP-like cAMP-binding protein